MINHSSSGQPAETTRRTAGRIALIYAGFALFWIFASDRLLLLLSVDPHVLSGLQTWKGGLFVLVTALLLFGLVRRALRREREQEERYRNMFENNHAVMLLIDPENGTIVDANPAACDFYGYNRDRLRTLRINDINTLGPAQISAEIAHARSQQRHFFEFPHRLADGTLRTVEVYTGPVTVAGRQFLYSIVHDISARKEAEQELQRLNRTLRVLSRGNEIMVRATAEGALLQGICDLLVNLGGYQLAWVGDPASRHIRAHAGSGLTCIDTQHLTADPQVDRLCPTLQAIRTRQPVVIREVWASPNYPHLRQPIETLDIAGMSVFPLGAEGDSFGALTIHSRDESAFDPKEVKLLSELAENLAFGIAALRNRETRRAVEAELRDSERYNRALFEQSPLGLTLSRLDGQLVDLNPAFARIIGRTIADALALTSWAITPERYLAEERQNFESLEATGSHGPYEKEYRHRDGHLVPVRLQGRLIERGGERFILSSVEDITSFKEAEANLKASESRYLELFRSNPHPMWVFDLETFAFLEVNDAAVRHYGYSRKEFLAMTIQDIRPADDVPLLLEYLRQAGEGMDLAGAWRHRKKDGTVIEVEISAHTVPFDSRPAKLVLAHDVTARRRTETAWRLSQFCIDNASVGIFRIDETGKIMEVNAQACRNLGYTHQELCALTVFDIDPLFDRSRWMEHRRSARARGTSTIETMHRRKDGSQFPVEVTVSYLEFEGQRLSFSFVRDITERKHAEDQFRHQATHDELTGLANRNLLQDRLEQSIHYANRSHRLVAVLLLDLDRFKVINDSLGHGFGDELLSSTARQLEQTVREADTVARMGGDEFAILLAEVAEEEDVGLVAKKILAQLTRPFLLDDREVTVTASIGISLYPRDGADAQTLLRNADVAMYSAKEEGNSFRFYAPEMDQRIMETLELEADLRRALERGELLLHYQPKVELTTGRVTGAEALLRWQHPQRGLISPETFIPLAEETGLILPIGEWVLATVCAQIKIWQSQGLPALQVAANLSARQFRKSDLAETVQRVLEENAVEPSLLELELTESILMRDPQTAAITMRRLKALGVSLALDDFGTGYSSLNYLRRFPVDSLKIDRSFISDVAVDATAAAFATSIVAIAHSLGLNAVAEGVETAEQLEFLANCGCDSLQGYYFSRPLSTPAFTALLRDGRRLDLN